MFESAGSRLRKVATTFDEWLTKRAARARKKYTKAQWSAVLSVRRVEPTSDNAGQGEQNESGSDTDQCAREPR